MAGNRRGQVIFAAMWNEPISGLIVVIRIYLESSWGTISVSFPSHSVGQKSQVVTYLI